MLVINNREYCVAGTNQVHDTFLFKAYAISRKLVDHVDDVTAIHMDICETKKDEMRINYLKLLKSFGKFLFGALKNESLF